MKDTRIRRIRKKAKLSGTVVAKQLGISAQHYYDIEKGENGLSVENAVKLAEILNVPLDYLLGISIGAIIEEKLIELNMTMKDLSKATELSEAFLRGLDTVPPAPWDYEKGELVDKIASVLEMDYKTLAAAFARQEPPAYDGPVLSPEEAFKQLQEDFADEPFDDAQPVERHVTEPPKWATNKDKRDFKKMLQEDAPVMFDGVPLDEEDKEKVLKVMEAIFWDAKKKNKRKPIDE